jgi:hypothetical protein
MKNYITVINEAKNNPSLRPKVIVLETNVRADHQKAVNVGFLGMSFEQKFYAALVRLGYVKED